MSVSDNIYDPYEYDEALDYKAAEYEDAEPVDETGTRNTWEIITWIIIALTIILNLVLIAILVLRRNLHSIVNKSECERLHNLEKFICKHVCFPSHIYCGHKRSRLRLHRFSVLCGELCQIQLGQEY